MTVFVSTLYTDFSAEFVEKLRQVRLLVCDVDGVFSDGRIYLGNDGEELKAFHTRDGYGVKALVNAGISVAVITGRRSKIVENRMKALNVAHIIQGEENKSAALETLMSTLGLTASQVAAVGDDIPDTGMFQKVAIKIAVKDAHPQVTQQANWITTIPGGFGAVREISDTFLQVHDKLHGIHGASV
ncbi:3-deoxy-manno-octulosonate-8-phosphatase KdsC [Alteromonas sp. KUL49]|uniref:3-deoxy-manno-octulosonate-8-phosphatase KdsC n=1 Tax=Alteromonas sp. KUL49 TaxID=2480798 RepID=UPI00102F2BB4|nr:3-deoxy-manno-octulosonate-8-phosphatase KdsC [Alteromonas sp. KUL49]TAP38874.1 3-deoxy-manno-octulosonate-8-phosphatase KdsC [Alteromonas sp. KUL49]GEA12309.1 3-deoxy-D-manno-octulosonate 8-phosphate phosphatase [Alteromonas sp. KUL49]